MFARTTSRRCNNARIVRREFGDSSGELEKSLLAEFSAAEIRRDDFMFKDLVGEILHSLEGKRAKLELPLDVRATAS